jgi:hypothetical protein
LSNITSLTGDTGGGGGTESGGTLKDLGGLPSGRPPVYAPSVPGGGASTGATPGTFNVYPLQPGESAAAGLKEGEGFLAGMKNAIFGTSQPDATGHHGGLVGDIPGLGAAGRLQGEVVANVAGGFAKGATMAVAGVGGALEHIDLSRPEDQQKLQTMFDQVPASDQKQEALDAIARDPGATGHYMAKAVNDYNAEERSKGNLIGTPDFLTGALKQTGSAAEAFDNILGALGLTARFTERTWTGIGTPGQGGLDRLGLIKAVGDGTAAFNTDKGVLGPASSLEIRRTR